MSELSLIRGKNYAPKHLGSVCVLGLGKSGRAVANYFCNLLNDRINSLHIYAGEATANSMKTADEYIKRGATVSFNDKCVNEKFDLCIVSPGIPEVSDLIKSANKMCNEVISEVELAWRECDKRCTWISITGTNGKTTTTSLTSFILKHANKKVECVGNIGNVALDAVANNVRKSLYEQSDIFVVELSSYQLTFCNKFSPKVAVLLNITPDHIDWHGTFESYKNAKLKVFENAGIGVINIEDDCIKDEINNIKNNNLEYLIINSYDPCEIIVDYKNEKRIKLNNQEMRIIGEHNCVNARAAASICVALQIKDKDIVEALKMFSPLEHRLEPCGIIAGIRLFNDSKATNIDSVLQAIKSFEKKKAIFMMGGKDKHTSLDKLVLSSKENLKAVVLFGEAKERFYKEFLIHQSDDFKVYTSENMKSAFKTAIEKALPGDYVVLSPACASFDEFKNFEERGEVFKRLVEKCKAQC